MGTKIIVTYVRYLNISSVGAFTFYYKGIGNVRGFLTLIITL